MATPTAAGTVQDHLWLITLDHLAHATEYTELDILLTLLGDLDAGELPIPALVRMYLRMAVYAPESISLKALCNDLDESILKPCLPLIENAPGAVPIAPIIEALRAAYASEEGDEEVQGRVLDLVGKLAGVAISIDDFTALLRDPVASLRYAGLEALYHLGRPDGMLDLLDDPVPAVRALAIENIYYTGIFPRERIQAMADDDQLDESVREQARHYLAQPAKR
jgi:hypothetical protein